MKFFAFFNYLCNQNKKTNIIRRNEILGSKRSRIKYFRFGSLFCEQPRFSVTLASLQYMMATDQNKTIRELLGQALTVAQCKLSVV